MRENGSVLSSAPPPHNPPALPLCPLFKTLAVTAGFLQILADSGRDRRRQLTASTHLPLLCISGSWGEAREV
jgi:hypothetical protein